MRSRILSLALLAGLSACATTVQQGDPAPAPAPPPKVFEPKIDLWSTGGSVVHRGEDIRVRFRTTDDGYVLVGRIDTDGRVEVLFPRRPGEIEHAWANQTYEVRRHGDAAFNVDDASGVGYVFAIVSPTPLRLSQFSRGGDWDYRQIDDVRGDPFVAMHHFAEQLVFDPSDYYSMDYVEYDVERQYAYPRFVCYDCHHGRPGWDVYDHSCPRYRVVVYDDPEYYPYRQGGQRVVYARPRYEFKDVVARNGSSDQGKIEYRTRDGRVVDRRRPGDPGSDPNIQPPNGGRWNGNGNAGATRPGDDTDGSDRNRDQDQDRRRGGVGVNNGSGNGANNGDNRGRFGQPVVDTSHAGGNGGGGNQNGNGGNGNGNGGGNSGNHPQPPVIGAGNGNGNGNGDCGRNGGNCGVGNGNGGGNGTGNEGNGNGPGSSNGNGNGHPQPPVTGNNGNGSGNNGNGGSGNANNGNQGNGNGNAGNQGNGNPGNGNPGHDPGNANRHGNGTSSAEPTDTRSKLLRNLGILKQRGDGAASQPERQSGGSSAQPGSEARSEPKSDSRREPERKSEPKPDAKPRTERVKDRDRSRPDSQ